MAIAEDSTFQQTQLWTSAFSYATCRTPVHVLAGNRDALVSHILHALPMAQLLPDARLTCLPGMGHMLHHFAIEEVAAAVAEVTQRADQLGIVVANECSGQSLASLVKVQTAA